MPLILENPMGGAAMQVDLGDVDDLFGDAPLALQNHPPSKRLLQRLDDLRSRGSCQGLAWSKTGTIASIAPDGLSLELRYIRARPKDATWGLSEPTTSTPWQDLAGGPIVHLSWAPTQTSELAIIDAVGRVTIVNFSTNVNRALPARRWDSDPVDDVNAVVGTYWLNTFPSHRNSANPLHAPAVKEGNTYNYETTLLISNAPYHPNPTRSVFFCVTINGMLKMFWNQNTNKIEETPLELESITSADDSVTHAALCSDSRAKCLFVALATSSKQLQVVQVAVNWGLPPPENQKGMLPASQPLNPSLKGRHVAITTWLPGGTSESHLDSSMTQISHMEFLPTALDQPNKSFLSPVVVIVRSYVPSADTPYNQEVQSIIDRWELILDQSQPLHSAFENLGSRRNSVGSASPAAQRLKRLESIIVNKVVIGISVIRMGTVVCFSYSDGTVEYRDRSTMKEMWTEVNLNRVNSIHEVGFTQSGEPSCLQTAVSPTMFSLVQIGEDGSMKWHGVNYALGDLASLNDAQYSAIVASLTMSAAQAAASQSNIDDILAVGRQVTGRARFPVDWVTEMVRMMRISVDYSEESHHDNLVRNNLLQLCLSTLNHLGWNGEFQPRNFRSKMSMFALNLRNIVILITIANNGPGHMKDRTPLDEPEVVDALAGCCRWSIDLLCWLADSLFCLLDDTKFMRLLDQQHFAEVTPYLLAKNDIALHMLLSSPIRGLLSAVCRRMVHLHNVSQRAITYYESRNGGAADTTAPPGSKGTGPPLTLHHAYQKMMRYTSTPLIDVTKFDALLSALGQDIRKCYADSFTEIGKRAAAADAAKKLQNPNAPKVNQAEEAVKRAQTHCELNMLLVGSPPPPFSRLVEKFFKEDLAAFRTHCDPAKLFFSDYGILEVGDEPQALAARKQRNIRVDLFKRVEIFPNKNKGLTQDGEHGAVPWRRCVRCASVMEDATHMASKPGIVFVLSQQRNCCCGGRLAVLGKGELVG
ncbi:RNA polymerase II mediator complex subunit Sin4 [Xylariales sp. AK1849]|nr:RNA polymerase II mediator complex subunit Sin4 [Xylariales sp. AK1849]